MARQVKTIYDFAPHFAYARLSQISEMSDVEDLLQNYVSDVDDMVESPIKPKLIQFGEALYIAGSMQDVVFASAFIKAHPGGAYRVEVYEDEEVAKERYENLFGMLPDEEPLPELEPFVEGIEPDVWFEDDDRIDEGNLDEQRSTSNAAIKVRNYIRKYTPAVNKCPLLIGHSGIAKSSIVKQIVQGLDKAGGWGYRLVEIRAGFLDKVDLTGYVDTVIRPDGQTVWTDSPKKELLLCNTEFVMECRDYLNNFDGEENEENKPFIDKLRFYAKTPVLFLDEVNRCPQSILDQVMRMVNASKIQEYDISICPKVAAANLSIDIDDLPVEKSDLITYLVDSMSDLASAGRFRKVYMSHTDRSVIESTFKYLTDKYKGSISAWVVLNNAHDRNLLYSLEHIDENGKFPTFRGWDDLCQYLEWVDNVSMTVDGDVESQGILWSVVTGLLGTEMPRDIFEATVHKINDSVSTDDFIFDSMQAGLPTALLGRLGVAKTAKLSKYADKMDATVESIDLSAEDRTTVSGFPEKTPFVDAIFSRKERGLTGAVQENEDEKGSSEFKAFKAKLNANLQVPKQTTVFVPNERLQRKIDDARASGKKMVLNFDEINRCSPIVQSAVFEAISENRLKGVDMTGVDFTVVCSGNWESPAEVGPPPKDPSEESPGRYMVEPIDTATLHRFCTKFITSINIEDLESFMNHLRKHR